MSKDEELVKIFLRLNGYFIVDNFIVHNGTANLSDSRDKIIPQSTETDILGIRLPYQNEKTGILTIANFKRLILNNDLIDLVIIESKTGNENRPNPTWKNAKRIDNIKYLIRFFGITDKQEVIDEVSKCLITNYSCKWDNYSLRYIIVSENINKYYNEKGVTYITIDEVLDFIVKIRGECWIDSGIGISSYHSQWNNVMNQIFEIANQVELEPEKRKKIIREYINK